MGGRRSLKEERDKSKEGSMMQRSMGEEREIE